MSDSRYGLGIDTGGTYTDAVIFDFQTESVVASAKSVTVKEDLTVGISGAIAGLPAGPLGEVKLVSLSTALATNACVEGKGSRAVLVMIGCDEEIAARYGREYGLPAAKDIIFLGGGHGQQGEVKGEPDWDCLRGRIEERRRETDAFAVVELWGIRNPEYEKKAKDLIAEWTGLQVVCGHELTGEVNSLKRAASALLNAQLIPIIADFLNAVKLSLAKARIEAPLVIVRGDGSLMSESFARGKPVETLLCGPAASVAGGLHLTGERNCVIIDMGGTTSDIAIVRDGLPRLASEGANIGKWRTGIQSILIDTVGLGGDSIIRHSAGNGLAIGPVRAAPLSWTASRWPGVLERIRDLHRSRRRDEISLCEFLYLVRGIEGDPFYGEEERAIARALRDGPLSVTELADATDTSIVEIRTRRLEQHGVIMRCALTPTDIMHLDGNVSLWNKDAAFLGASIMAHQIGATLDELVELVGEGVKEKLYFSIVKMLMEDEDESLLKGGISRQLEALLGKSFARRRAAARGETDGRGFLDCGFSTSATLVGIGAPIHLYLPDVAKALGAAYVVPRNAGVANAVGAITGNVIAEETVIVRPRYSVAGITGYISFSSAENRSFSEYDEALEWARRTARELAQSSAAARGAREIEISVSVDDSAVQLPGAYAEGLPAETEAADEVADGNDDESEGESLAKPDSGPRLGAAAAAPERPSTAARPPAPGSRLLLETLVTARAAGKITWA
ncbi:MAG: hydantoinase/oxoprolinase family protein [Treponema sp.]|nr:hydantoinase/oxoprolinase family protein [Treponema sp.]